MPPKAASQAEPNRSVGREGGGLFLITWNLQNWRSHRMRRMNLIYFPSEAPATCSNTPSFTGGPHIFPERILEHRMSGGVLAEANLLAGPVCISALPPPHQHFYHRELELIRQVYVCEEPEPFIAEATSCAFRNRLTGALAYDANAPIEKQQP